MFTDAERVFAEQLDRMNHCNPFSTERMQLEQAALGEHYNPQAPGLEGGPTAESVRQLTAAATDQLRRCRDRLAAGEPASEADWRLYRSLAEHALFATYLANSDSRLELTDGATESRGVWREVRDQHQTLFAPPYPEALREPPAHLYAVFFQIRRAFWNIFQFVVGESAPATRLREAIWRSIFSHDMRRYRRLLWDRMAQIPTLVTGPSGTGKELVARAVGMSQYIPFDAKREAFEFSTRTAFIPLNLAALSPTLIESEIFGHCRGAFTGAVSDRSGWLEQCPAYGAVFLDEIGELELAIQVKLLRVVQERRYARLGESAERPFQGKLIAATNRTLTDEIAAGRFREDLFYRLCADRIHTPTLCEHLDDNANALQGMVRFIAARLLGEHAEDVQQLTDEVLRVVEQKLGPGYPWPGNFRELEQCVRNVLVHQTYDPASGRPPAESAADIEWLEQARRGELTLAELTQRYCAWVWRNAGDLEQAARSLGVDRRTLKSKAGAPHASGG